VDAECGSACRPGTVRYRSPERVFFPSHVDGRKLELEVTADVFTGTGDESTEAGSVTWTFQTYEIDPMTGKRRIPRTCARGSSRRPWT